MEDLICLLATVRTLKLILYPINEYLFWKRNTLRPLFGAAPIQIASDLLDKLIFASRTNGKFIIRVAKGLLKESSEPSKKRLESSAKREILTSSTSTGIPLILTLWQIVMAIVSIMSKNREGEIWQPWKMPLNMKEKKPIISINVALSVGMICFNPRNE